MVKCIDLKKMYGKRFKISLDDAAQYEVNGRNDPWMFMIPCKYGHIYPISDEYLGFYCESKNIKTRICREQPDIELVQDADVEGVFKFPPQKMEVIAKYARPKRKRQVSEKERKRLAVLSQNHSPFTSINGTKTGQESTISNKVVY